MCVCCTGRPRAREAAPAACAGSLRLRTPSSVAVAYPSSTLAAGHGFGKEAHETVSWEKGRAAPGRLRGDGLFPALVMTHVRNAAVW